MVADGGDASKYAPSGIPEEGPEGVKRENEGKVSVCGALPLRVRRSGVGDIL
jgi:hypothetical protein